MPHLECPPHSASALFVIRPVQGSFSTLFAALLMTRPYAPFPFPLLSLAPFAVSFVALPHVLKGTKEMFTVISK